MFTRTNRIRLLALAHHLCAKLPEAMAEDVNTGISASANPSGNLRADYNHIEHLRALSCNYDLLFDWSFYIAL